MPVGAERVPGLPSLHPHRGHEPLAERSLDGRARRQDRGDRARTRSGCSRWRGESRAATAGRGEARPRRRSRPGRARSRRVPDLGVQSTRRACRPGGSRRCTWRRGRAPPPARSGSRASSTASITSRPSPGQPNTVSTMIEPFSSATNSERGEGHHGQRGVLEGVLPDHLRSGRPLIRASLTYSVPSTSSMAERVSRMSPATANQPSVMPGSMHVQRRAAAGGRQQLQHHAEDEHEQQARARTAAPPGRARRRPRAA